MTEATLLTERLELRRPTRADAEAIFRRYAGDAEVTRYLSWPTHRSVHDTLAFVSWSDEDWARWPSGSQLIFSRADHQLLGGTGLSFHSPRRAVTGYVLARDAWGKGYATEALRSMVELARSLEVQQLEAVCHVDHLASAHVLEKCGFLLRGIQRSATTFPNLGEPSSEIRNYVRTL